MRVCRKSTDPRDSRRIAIDRIARIGDATISPIVAPTTSRARLATTCHRRRRHPRELHERARSSPHDYRVVSRENFSRHYRKQFAMMHQRDVSDPTNGRSPDGPRDENGFGLVRFEAIARVRGCPRRDRLLQRRWSAPLRPRVYPLLQLDAPSRAGRHPARRQSRRDGEDFRRGGRRGSAHGSRS